MNNFRLYFLLIALFLPVFTMTGCFEGDNLAPQITGKDMLTSPSDTSYLPSPSKSIKFPTARATLAGRTIIIDAGHGGKDPGAGKVGYSRMWEKDIVIDIACKTAANLKAKGAKVIMTRSDDTFIELNDRAAFADRFRADALVSIHADACDDPQIGGPSFYVSRRNDRTSRNIAESLEDVFSHEGIKTRGVRQADYRVLVRHSHPAVLVETGYLTNRDDAHKLNSSWYRSKVAGIIVQGLEEAF